MILCEGKIETEKENIIKQAIEYKIYGKKDFAIHITLIESKRVMARQRIFLYNLFNDI